MTSYVISMIPHHNGNYEVHDKSHGCPFMPSIYNLIQLGEFKSCSEAIHKAKEQWPELKISGCYFCCTPCHTK